MCHTFGCVLRWPWTGAGSKQQQQQQQQEQQQQQQQQQRQAPCPHNREGSMRGAGARRVLRTDTTFKSGIAADRRAPRRAEFEGNAPPGVGRGDLVETKDDI